MKILEVGSGLYAILEETAISTEELNTEHLTRNGDVKVATRDRLKITCCCLVTKLCPLSCDPIDCSPPGSSVHSISQARILEWVVISLSRGSS